MTESKIPAAVRRAARDAAATVLPDLQNDIRAAQVPLAHLLRTALQLAADEALDAAADAIREQGAAAERASHDAVREQARTWFTSTPRIGSRDCTRGELAGHLGDAIGLLDIAGLLRRAGDRA